MAVWGSVLLLGFGAYAFIVMDNLIKKVFAMNIISSATVLFIIAQGYKPGATAPILADSPLPMVDPLPQALMLTAIVINLCMTALALVFIIRLFESERTLNESQLDQQLKDQ
ncbi:MAG TPA: cation:proton antiporter subunit C [bacterium]|nr:cation:proton antiporter subunit C [bacterium]